MTADPYVDPATGLLINLLGIVDANELRRAEADITSFALRNIERHGISGDYDLPHLCMFHRVIFGDIYEWAGRIRTVRIAKGDMFCLPQFIESAATDILGALRREGCLRSMSRDGFVERLTFYFGELNAVHPFREGNGRVQRAFWGQLAREADHPIRWERLDAERNLAASVAIMRGDSGPMQAMLDHLIDT